MIGERLAQFEITGKLGEGGMGEVYRARDSKLGREVAIKVLPEAVAADPERLARFEREAKVLASLNHPAIASIYSFESGEPQRVTDDDSTSEEGSDRPSTSGPVHFIVMELVEGQDLRERLAAGRVPLRECLEIAQQIALALEAAHARGVVHRDLKPANVKLSPDGKVKVLDFGLAKALAPGSDPESNPLISASPTLTQQMTEAGVLLGTAAYMSPEQARGKPVDKRSDIWAFGCLLLEMLSGQRTFGGDTLTDVIAAVVAREPNWESLPSDTPRGIRRLLRRCLEKDQDQRLHDIADARIEIGDCLRAIASGQTSSNEELEERGERRGRRDRVWIAATALATILAAIFGWLAFSPSEPERPVIRTTLPAPSDSLGFVTRWNGPGPATVSPDGRRIAFSAFSSQEEWQLWVREIDELEARPIGSATMARYPFWSPDSRFVAFFDDAKLKKVEASGGPSLPLCDAPNGKGGSWNEQGVILFAPSHNSGIFRVSASGGESVEVTQIDEASGENSHRHPRFLPDGEHFLYVARVGVDAESEQGGATHRVYLASLDGSTRRLLFESDYQVEVALNHLWWVLEGTLMAQPFETRQLELRSEPFPLAEGVMAEPGAAFGLFSTSEAGVLAYHTGATGLANSELVWWDREGNELGNLGGDEMFGSFRLAPDGRSAAVVLLDPVSSASDIWIYDLEREIRTRFTFGPEDAVEPIWSPDGRRLAYSLQRAGVRSVQVQEVGGAGEAEPFYAHEGQDAYPVSWSPDGRRMVVSVTQGIADFDLWLVPLDQPGGAEPLIATEHREDLATISPDGRWLAYTSDDSGSVQVYVTPFPEVGRRWQVSTTEGGRPTWRSDGRELFFMDGDGGLYVASVDGSGETFRIGGVERLFGAEGVRESFSAVYDMTADGQRALVNTLTGDSASTSPPATLVFNVQEELSRP